MLLDPPPDGPLLKRLLREQAPELSHEPLMQLPGGRDNAVIRVGSRLVARLPLHEVAAPLMRTEQRWLPALSRSLPVPTSAAVVIGQPGAGYPFPWTVARWVDGTTADRTDFDTERMAAALIALFAGLHRPAPADAPTNPVRAVPLSERLPRFVEHLDELDHPHKADLTRELTRLAAVPVPTSPRVWCHGDLHPRNIVVDDGSMAGVIDWGDLHGGDPVVDYAATWMLLPGNQVERVRRAVDADLDTWARARGWALVFGALLMRIGSIDDDAPFSEAGRVTLERAMSQSPD